MKKYIFTILCFAIALNAYAGASKTYKDLEVNACEDRSPGYANNGERMIENARRHARSWCQFNWRCSIS